MLTLRASKDRGHADFGWLDTRHSFAFGEFFDPAHVRFSDLRVLNEDRVQPGKGFGTHGHRDMEILTWVLEGGLEHQDSLGSKGVIRPLQAQVMSAGTGIRHAEMNGSDKEPVHFLQIWILPEAEGLPPRYGQVDFQEADVRDRWRLIASRDGAEGSALVHQDIRIHAARLSKGASLSRDLDPSRNHWLQIARGALAANGLALSAGDGLALSSEARLDLMAIEPSEVLFFDLR
ncbi:MAG TPA: pirin family protein [Holophagaceae bacterium]|jgi:redox-sensitive bicupin YhaK (pirin superfamily)|nr:pirin family protein [Holophagaceae bacterium]